MQTAQVLTILELECVYVIPLKKRPDVLAQYNETLAALVHRVDHRRPRAHAENVRVELLSWRVWMMQEMKQVD